LNLSCCCLETGLKPVLFRQCFGSKKFQTQNKILYEKGARKMLMKLTPGLIDPPSLVLPRYFKWFLTNCVLGSKKKTFKLNKRNYIFLKVMYVPLNRNDETISLSFYEQQLMFNHIYAWVEIAIQAREFGLPNCQYNIRNLHLQFIKLKIWICWMYQSILKNLCLFCVEPYELIGRYPNCNIASLFWVMFWVSQ